MDATTQWDVVICGGGMAGLTLARQLHLELPGLRVAVAERSRRPIPASCHKVGESNAELGSLYLDRLGLRDYLGRHHIVKLGLRMFPGGGTEPLEARTELGPALEPVVRGYQIDRGRFEQDLRGMVEDDGTTLWEGTTVRTIELASSDGMHRIELERGGARTRVRARWVVDASGRTGLLRRRFGTKEGTEHAGNSGWFRIDERIDMSELVASPDGPWHERALSSERWRSTNHLMGHGYWVWLIALPKERMSIGVVTHDAVHGFERVRTLPRVMAFFEEHEPALAARLANTQVLDFRCIKAYSYGIARSWSAQRWAIVGEAGAFVDPLYSPGSDFIALSNSMTCELVRADLAGEDLQAVSEALDDHYRGLLEGSLGVYRKAAPVYGHARAMAAKVYWDNFAYWSYTCQYFVQGLFRVRAIDPEVTAIRRRFVALSGYVQSLLHAWASAHPERPTARFMAMPPFPSYSVEAHLALREAMSPTQTVEMMRTRARIGEQMVAELVVRLLLEYGPHEGWRMLEQADFPSFELPFDAARIDAESTVGLARRRALSDVVRDVERSLGRVERHPDWKDALARLPMRP